ncbi:MAG TPA: DUF5985 family protein [Tepidisphaeraceae bacterium]|jgi:hypothetical protein|nr:DUF5985 family protein [Tepidisphaeraceae bacterium]
MNDWKTIMNEFLQGASVMACLAIGLIFLRFWQKSHDRLFIFFAAAFWLLGLNWLCLALIRTDESETSLYLIRLAAFLILLLGILDKNRAKKSETPPQ